MLANANKRFSDDKVLVQFHPTPLRSLVSAGRLDIDSVGLLVLKQDSWVAKKFIGEDTEINLEEE